MKKTFSLLALFLILVMLASCAKTATTLEGGENTPQKSTGSFKESTTNEKTATESHDTETETPSTESSASVSKDPSPSSVTEPTLSEESPSSTVPSEQTPPIAGTLYEYRANFSDTFLPVRSGLWLGGQLSYGIDGSHEAILVRIGNQIIEMAYTNTCFYTDEAGQRHAISHSYSAGDRFVFTTSSGAVLDTEGRLVSLMITNFDLPDGFDETMIRKTACDIAEGLTDLELDSRSAILTTTVQDETGHKKVDGFITENADSYTVSFRVEIGGLKSGKYIDVTFSPYGIPVPLMYVEIGNADTEKYDRYISEDYNKQDIFESMLFSLPGILQEECTVSSVYFDEDTLLFTEIDGRPCFYVSTVVTMEDGMQYLTNLCYFIEIT